MVRCVIVILFAVVAAACLPPQALAASEQYELYLDKGLALLDSKDYDKAVECFTKAENADPANIEAAFYLGQAYWRGGDIDKAIACFENVYKASPDSSYGKASKKYLDAGRGGEAKRYYLNAFTGMQYDTNVDLKPRVSSYRLEKVDTKVDWSWLFYLRGGYSLPVASGFSLSAEYGLYESLHLNLNDYDVQNNDLSIYASYNKGPVTAYVAYLFRDTYLGGSSFETVNGVMPKVRVEVNKNVMLEAYYTFERRDFNQHDDNPWWWWDVLREKDRDSNNSRYSLDGYYYFMDRQGWARLGYYYEDNEADSEKWSYWGHGAVAGLSIPLPWKMQVLADGEYQYRSYGKTFSMLTWRTKDRHNNNYRGSFTLTKQITKNLGVLASYSYIREDSDFAEFDYDRNLCTILFSAKF